MKKNVHPKYSHNVKVTCSCGNSFVTGSILDEIVTELCSKCHPFYTGEQKIVDSENLVRKFEERRAKAQSSFRNKKQKMAERKQKMAKIQQKTTSSGLSLKDLLAKSGK